MEVFNIHLPIIGNEFNVLLFLLIGFTVGVCGGFFGIGGAWIVTPALNIFGFPMPYAIGTDLAHMGGKSIVSTIRHGRFGNVDVKLGMSMIVGTSVGMELGARLVMYLEALGLAELVIRRIYVVFLFAIGGYVLYDYSCHARRRRRKRWPGRRRRTVHETFAQKSPAAAHSADGPFAPPASPFPLVADPCVGLITGVVASVLGVGGGFIRMPALIYLVGCPTVVAVGTDLFEIMITGCLRCVHLRCQRPRGSSGCHLDVVRRRPRGADGHCCGPLRARLLHSLPVRRDDLYRLHFVLMKQLGIQCGILGSDFRRRDGGQFRHHRLVVKGILKERALRKSCEADL